MRIEHSIGIETGTANKRSANKDRKMILKVHKEKECNEEQKELDDIKMKSMKMLHFYDRRGLRVVE